jgi:CRISPR-associated protein Cmr1
MATATRWKELEFTIRFLTPAFLGDAEQKGRWRTPPFKALLRQWWRVAYAAQQNYDVSIADLRKAEGKLFGNAWLTREEDGKAKADYCSSRVRLRLDRWDRGELQTWEKLEPRGIQHPEVEKLPQIGPHLYLGYGPLIVPRGATITTLKNAPAIHAGKTATLRLAFPAGEETLLLQALRLMHLYGTAGGRSRNGWGSFVLEPRPDGSAPIPTRTWEAALAQSWAHAIGEDEHGVLIWRTAKHVFGLARAHARPGHHPHCRADPVRFPEGRNLTSSPSRGTGWLIRSPTTPARPWGKQLRLPNSLRFKVRPASGNAKQLDRCDLPYAVPAAGRVRSATHTGADPEDLASRSTGCSTN